MMMERRPTTRISAEDALERWTYKKAGMDYGPFTSREVHQMIEAGDITADTEIYSRMARRWYRVSEAPSLKAYLEERSRKEAETRRLQEIQQDHQQVERTSRMGTWLPVALGGVLAVGLGIAAFFLLQPPSVALAGYPVTFFRDLSFERVAPIREFRTEPIQLKAVEPEPAKDRNARKAVRRAARNGNGTAVIEAPVLDLMAEDISGGRSLTQEDINSVQHAVGRALVRCFRQEVTRNPYFEGGTVSLYMMTRGDVAVSRVDTQPAPSGELVGCIRASTRGVRVPPFAGANQVMEIPIYVSNDS